MSCGGLGRDQRGGARDRQRREADAETGMATSPATSLPAYRPGHVVWPATGSPPPDPASAHSTSFTGMAIDAGQDRQRFERGPMLRLPDSGAVTVRTGAADPGTVDGIVAWTGGGWHIAGSDRPVPIAAFLASADRPPVTPAPLQAIPPGRSSRRWHGFILPMSTWRWCYARTRRSSPLPRTDRLVAAVSELAAFQARSPAACGQSIIRSTAVRSPDDLSGTVSVARPRAPSALHGRGRQTDCPNRQAKASSNSARIEAQDRASAAAS